MSHQGRSHAGEAMGSSFVLRASSSFQGSRKHQSARASVITSDRMGAMPTSERRAAAWWLVFAATVRVRASLSKSATTDQSEGFGLQANPIFLFEPSSVVTSGNVAPSLFF